ncbi:MAG: tRNA preQ1(34) S-adenosylmethionine ribosyltransferase-isomerase QueA, partial [Chitinivibrionales bacterium]|nr:tRNA preQ1(34) S-adenosylmethionine ribosyltransferase-isomerase QueA [Chitinivibrionales bacterium]
VHHRFRDLPALLRRGDHLIINNTKVLPARMFCRKDTGARVELLFIEELTPQTWRVMGNPGKKLKPGSEVLVDSNSDICFIVKDICENGDRIVLLKPGSGYGTILQAINAFGMVPLPPYIRRESRDRDRNTYQTVYASKEGAVAAPTAGLHFTDDLINILKNKGISISEVTLHVGPGTFIPVKETDPRNHRMHRERFELPAKTAERIAQVSRGGGRNIAVGTTVVRVLEHCARQGMPPVPGTGETGLMILPGYRFRVVDGLITNFHLPGSTLLMLVSAFAGRERVLRAYEEAVRLKYRFYSYGDAMIIL